MTLTSSEPTAGEFADVAANSPYLDLDVESRVDFLHQDGQVLLCGSQSTSSGSMAFPARAVCQMTGTLDMEPITFGPNGVLYSYSTIHVSSNRPVPYTIGYVDFPNGLRVLAQVRDMPANLPCDAPVTLKADGADWWVEALTQSENLS